MKLNKTILHTFAAVAVTMLALTSLIFTSCKNGLMGLDEQEVSETATVTFNVGDVSSRTINPAVTATNLTNITISYKAASASAVTAATELVSGKTSSDLGTYEIPLGEYVFSATASVNEIIYSASVTKTINAGANSVELSFSKSRVDTLVSGTGYISVEFTLEDDSVKGVKATLQNCSDNSVKIETKSLIITDGKVTYKVNSDEDAIAPSVDAGTYRLILEFYSDSECTVKLGSYREIVNVTKDFTSSAERTISNASNDVYTITYHLNGGTLTGGVTLPESVTRLTQITLPTASQITKASASFEGWYLDEICSDGKKVTEVKDITGNIDLYAKWTGFLSFKGDEAFKLGIRSDATEGQGKYWNGILEYSTDKVTWTEWDGSEQIPSSTDDGNYYIYLRGKNNTHFAIGTETAGHTSFYFVKASATGVTPIKCTGDIMTLLDYENPDEAVMDDYCFYKLFYSCTSLKKAPLLSATTLSKYCYSNMFYYCTSLTEAPALPAETLADYCYDHMFYYCELLTAAPELPAATLADYCYSYMFFYCTTLNPAPELPAENLAEGCYQYMFGNDTGLTSAPELPATNLAANCYEYMFYGCTGLTESPALPAVTLKDCCYEGMFYMCSNLTYPGKITATVIDKTKAMYLMFGLCNKLIVVVQDSADTKSFVSIESVSEESAIDSMFTGCSDNGSNGYEGRGVVGKSYKAKPTCYVNWKASNLVKVDDSSDYGATLYSVAKKAGKIVIGNSTTYASFVTGLTQYNAGETDKDEVYAYFDPTAATPDLYVLADGAIIFEDDDSSTFRECSNATEITLDNMDTSAMTNMSNMFLRCSNVTALDVSGFDTSKVTNMSCMFDHCTLVTSLDLSGFNTAAVTDMSSMFGLCFALTSLDLSSFNTSSVTNMWFMFGDCRVLTTLTLSSFDTSKVTNMSSMFEDCYAFTSLDLSNFDTAAVTTMSRMFNTCKKLTSVDLSNFDTSKVTDMSMMFMSCSTLTKLDLSSFNWGSVTTLKWMFRGCRAITKIYIAEGTDLTSIDSSNAAAMFGDDSYGYCTNLKGGQGTTFTSGTTPADNTYAREDGGADAPGLFSIKEGFLTFIGNSSFTLGVDMNSIMTYSVGWDGTLEYSTDRVTWTEWTMNNDEIGSITAAESDGNYYIYMRGKGNTHLSDGDNANWTKFVFSGGSSLKVECSGNIMTLLDYEDPDNVTMAKECFNELFCDCTQLTTPPELPAMTLAESCYSQMFYGCTSLTTAPVLPATTLAKSCYNYMFRGCTSLTTAPALPATTLAEECYSYMFFGCTSLTAAPALPATTLENKCYMYMFVNCTSLRETPVLPATTLADYCYKNMFSGCTSITTAPELNASKMEYACYQFMFENCTSLRETPVLASTELDEYCYFAMFSGCSSLTTTPALPATILKDLCYEKMFQNCTGLTSVSKISTTTGADYAMLYMFSGCTGLKIVSTTGSDGFITIPSSTATEYVNQMFYNCKSGTETVTPVAGKSYKVSAD